MFSLTCYDDNNHNNEVDNDNYYNYYEFDRKVDDVDIEEYVGV